MELPQEEIKLPEASPSDSKPSRTDASGWIDLTTKTPDVTPNHVQQEEWTVVEPAVQSTLTPFNDLTAIRSGTTIDQTTSQIIDDLNNEQLEIGNLGAAKSTLKEPENIDEFATILLLLRSLLLRAEFHQIKVKVKEWAA